MNTLVAASPVYSLLESYSEIESQRQNLSGNGPAKIKYVGCKVYFLVSERDQHAALDVQACVVGPGSLRHQAQLQPFQRRVRDLVPIVEEAATSILCIEYKLAVTVELNPLVVTVNR